MSGDEIRWSAVDRLHATGMFHTTATRNNALTSGSWGWASSGSQKKIITSIVGLGDAGPDLHVAAERPALQPFDGQSEVVFEDVARGAGRYQPVWRQRGDGPEDRNGGVSWPTREDPLIRLVATDFPFPSSDHRLVSLNVTVPGRR